MLRQSSVLRTSLPDVLARLGYVVYWPPTNVTIAEMDTSINPWRITEVTEMNNVVAIKVDDYYTYIVSLNNGRLELQERREFYPLPTHVIKGKIRGKYRVKQPNTILPVSVVIGYRKVVPVSEKEFFIEYKKYDFYEKYSINVRIRANKIVKDLQKELMTLKPSVFLLQSLADVLPPFKEPTVEEVLKELVSASSVEEFINTKPEIVSHIHLLITNSDELSKHMEIRDEGLCIFGYSIRDLKKVLAPSFIKEMLREVIRNDDFVANLLDNVLKKMGIYRDKATQKVRKKVLWDITTTVYSPLLEQETRKDIEDGVGKLVLSKIIEKNIPASVEMSIESYDSVNNIATIALDSEHPLSMGYITVYAEREAGCHLEGVYLVCPPRGVIKVAKEVTKATSRLKKIISEYDTNPSELITITERALSIVGVNDSIRKNLAKTFANALHSIYKIGKANIVIDYPISKDDIPTKPLSRLKYDKVFSDLLEAVRDALEVTE